MWGLKRGAPIQARGWRGIVPLHSNRADVERLLGHSTDPCKCIYNTEDEIVSIDYASDRCKNGQTGWNVAAGTVLSLRVAPKKVRRFSELQIDEIHYRKVKDLHTSWVYYINDEEGTMFEVSSDGILGGINYIPAAIDASLRCSGAPLRSAVNYPVFDEYGNIAFNDEKARLDNFAAQLQHFTESVGYIIVYPGLHASWAKARTRARRAKNYILRVRRIEPSRVVTIDGGRRQQFTVELYIVPKEKPAPSPEPGIGRR
ncbi:MAG: hypothetical protein AABN95_14720 [Acidobacteriota bacterium]